MEDRPGFFDETLLPILDDGPTPADELGLGFFDKAQANEAGLIVDPSLSTASITPFQPGAQPFLTPSSTSISPRSSVDYFTDHARNFSISSEAVAPHDTVSSNDLLFNRKLVTTSATPVTARRRGKAVARASEQAETLELSLAPVPVPALAPAPAPTLDLSSELSVPDLAPDPAPGPSNATRPKRRKSGVLGAKSPQPPKRKSGRPSKKAENQRSKNLERNRIAASKCRQKKKEWVQELEDNKNELGSRNSALRMECQSLLDEVNLIKTSLMAHAGCGDANINFWIEKEAFRYVVKCSASRNAASLSNAPVPGHAPVGSISGSISQPLPSPSESLDAHVTSPEFHDLGINLDYMPDELLTGESLQ